MKYSCQLTLLLIFAVLFFSCSEKNLLPSFIVKNNLEIPRVFETLSLNAKILGLDSLENLGIRDKKTREPLVIQAVDLDKDGIIDELLFQPEIEAKSQRIFEIFKLSTDNRIENEAHCYSRFVPERTDDYAWENNRVAYRTYGPKAQEMVENNIAGGTLSSGIDAWLKKVEYPIINKWYNKELETDGSYHIDDGEGLDNFHVGVSRGVGGTAVKVDSVYYSSKNFIQYKTLFNGPIRTSFELQYGSWDAGGKLISEKKLISLDYGSNFSKFEVHLKGTDFLSVGLTLHENDGVVIEESKNGFISYWQPHGTSELGTAIVSTKDVILGSEKFVSSTKDMSNAFLNLKVHQGKVIFYSGFGWKESKQYENHEQWLLDVASFAEKVNSPLVIALVN